MALFKQNVFCQCGYQKLLSTNMDEMNLQLPYVMCSHAHHMNWYMERPFAAVWQVQSRIVDAFCFCFFFYWASCSLAAIVLLLILVAYLIWAGGRLWTCISLLAIIVCALHIEINENCIARCIIVLLLNRSQPVSQPAYLICARHRHPCTLAHSNTLTHIIIYLHYSDGPLNW